MENGRAGLNAASWSFAKRFKDTGEKKTQKNPDFPGFTMLEGPDSPRETEGMRAGSSPHRSEHVK